jgi:inosose dehydratase
MNNGIKFGCQTYSWQISDPRYRGDFPHLVGAARGAGFAGIEPEPVMLGPYRDAARARDVLDGTGLQLSSVAFVADWLAPEETPEERAQADHFIDFLSHFPGSLLMLVQQPGQDRSDLPRRQDAALSCIDDVAARAIDAGLEVSFHPNSPRGSVFRTREDYARMFDHLANGPIGWTPDIGHIVAGGMDPVELVSEHRSLVNHVHLKDVDSAGGWAPTGKGVIDFPSVISCLASTDFAGWIVMEDESTEAAEDPDSAVVAAGAYTASVLAPLTTAPPASRSTREE